VRTSRGLTPKRGQTPLLLALLFAGHIHAAAAEPWKTAAPDYAWSFPRDHWAHREYRIEWWYFTGHLETDDAPKRKLGFQLTLFRIGLTPAAPALDSDWAASSVLLGHAALTDKDGQRHRFAEVLYRETPFLAGFGAYPDPQLAWSRAPAGTDGIWRIRATTDGFALEARDDTQGFAFDLALEPGKPLVLQGPNGLSRKAEAPGAASLYYSFTRLGATGQVELDGRRHAVRGQAWMDHEFSTSQLTAEQVGWDWFSLQLEDGRDVMLYSLRRADGSADFARGTIVDKDGGARLLGAEEWTARPTERWTSPRSRGRYPARWVVTVPSERLVLEARPTVADQENSGRLAFGLHYWEGSVTVHDSTGRTVGVGYVELTGYAPKSRPPL